MSKLVLLATITVFVFLIQVARAEVKLPAVISDHMVLQQGMKVPLWGWAQPGETVTIALADQRSRTTADAQGRWIVRLNPLKTGGPFDLTVTGKNTIKVRDVLIGEVWFGSGQSNMQWPVHASRDAAKEIGAANYPKIRLFHVDEVIAETPLEDVRGQWVSCSPETVGSFSAVSYFFGRNLHKTLNVPVGLIYSSFGGSPSESWTRYDELKAHQEFKPLLNYWKNRLASYPEKMKQYERDLAQWEQGAKKAKEANQVPPAKPRKPYGKNNPNLPGVLYNGMIHPIIPFGIRGVIWYQGESNSYRAFQYRRLFPLLIHSWRRDWGQGDFPFLFVQLPNYGGARAYTYAELREAQLLTLKTVPNTGMAVTIDIGEANDIHPQNKQDVGYRLSLIALAKVYGRGEAYSGPVYDSMQIKDHKVYLRFKHADGGLIVRGGPLKGFAIADRKNMNFVPAEAKIEGDTVVVWNDKIVHPVAVRYAWADNPECNLYNGAELPAGPFRTDDWPGGTDNNNVQ
ncbi:MAG: sialate O-acetylesterase [Phycisphaerae bacterium]